MTAEAQQTRLSPGRRRFWYPLASWGVWPCLVMLLAQWDAAKILSVEYPMGLMWITAAGTLSIYGTDRWFERHFLRVTAERHQPSGRLDLVFIIVITTFTVFAFLSWEPQRWPWFLVLGAAGMVYLLVTARRVVMPPLTKELLGALLFTYLTWGALTQEFTWTMFGFFLMGFSNFLWSAHQDRSRDRQNRLTSLAVLVPVANIMLARASALLAAGLIGASSGIENGIFWTAICHAFWPLQKRIAIDVAFLPLLLSAAII